MGIATLQKYEMAFKMNDAMALSCRKITFEHCLEEQEDINILLLERGPIAWNRSTLLGSNITEMHPSPKTTNYFALIP